MPSVLRKYPLLIRCLAFAAALVVVGALVLVIDSSEGTYFLLSLIGAALGFPSVWLVQEVVYGLEEHFMGRPNTLYTTILAVGLLINWLLIGLAAELIRRVRRRSALTCRGE
jgi:ABC-type tungstate transport system substrate-binding protein